MRTSCSSSRIGGRAFRLLVALSILGSWACISPFPSKAAQTDGGAETSLNDGAIDGAETGRDAEKDVVSPHDASNDSDAAVNEPDSGPGCTIAMTTYPEGSSNPTNACLSCQPAVSTMAWSPVSDGMPCGAGEVCSSGTCGVGCFIGGTVYASAAVDATNACESCQPGISMTAWSPVTNGTACGAGEVCGTGTCAAGCFIGGAIYASAALDPNDPCQSCQPGTSTTAWSNVANGTACGNGQLCSAGQCGTQCDIGGTIFATGAVDSTNACQTCQPGTSTSAWTDLSNGSACGTGEVCNSATCVAGCFISGTVYPSATVDPTNPCLSCQPAASTTAWTDLAAGTSCGGGEVCSAGTCASGCFISGTVYATGAVDATNSCLSCQPGVSTTAYSDLPLGTSCGTGEVCSGATCEAACFIGGAVIASGVVDTTNPCLSCQPAVSTTAYKDLPVGTSCGAGEVCNGANCEAACFIGGAIFASGAVDPTNACLSCQPGVSTTAWSDLTNGSSCGTGGICVTGSCTSGCYVGGVFSTTGAVNPANPCQTCQPSASTSAFTNANNISCTGVAGGTCCSGACVNEATDTNNCGACGNACTAGPSPLCSMGQFCEYTLASGQNTPIGIAVDSTSVYWTDGEGGTVMKTPIGGGTVTTLASGQSTPYGIAVDPTSVYWVDGSGGTVMKIGINATTATVPTTLYSGGEFPIGIAVDSTSVYWTDFSAGTVMKTPIGATTATTPTTLASGQSSPYGIAVDPTSVYWNDEADTVMKIAINATTATTPTTLASGQETPTKIAVDATNVYWTDTGGNTVMKTPINATSTTIPTTLASGQASPFGIAVDATSVYWTNENSAGTIMKIPISGGVQPTTLASGQMFPEVLVVDATSVYWTNGTSSGTIMKVQK